MGSGRSSLLRTLFAVRKPGGGTLNLRGQPYPTSIARAMRAGIGFLPEDRDREGLIRTWSIWRNLSLPSLPRLSRAGQVPDEDEERRAAEAIKVELGVKAASIDVTIAELSGGNAQKVALGRSLMTRPKLLLLDEPTVGVDVGVKADILASIRRLADDEGVATVVVSSAFEELCAVCDRIIVLQAGSIVGEVEAEGLDEAAVMRLVGSFEATAGVAAGLVP
jgi:ribose transport system ATP-binding protein